MFYYGKAADAPNPSFAALDPVTLKLKKTDEQLMEFFDPYLRKTGIKGEITKGKLKWRGVKMTVKSDIYSSVFQLVQRGETISPEFKANFRLNQNIINTK